MPSERDKAKPIRTMRYFAALLVSTILSIGVFSLPWIVQKIVPNASGEVELTPATMTLIAVFELIYTARWLVVLVVFVLSGVQAWAGDRSP